jgi:ketosteroid isomerase-like protein
MAEHPNVAPVRDMFAASAKGDLAALNDVFAEDLVWHEGGRNQLSHVDPQDATGTLSAGG